MALYNHPGCPTGHQKVRDRKLAVLEFIKWFAKEYRRAPTAVEIAEALGLSEQRVKAIGEQIISEGDLD
jgi:DNA-directed RNA polymerase specialized sigma subunit